MYYCAQSFHPVAQKSNKENVNIHDERFWVRLFGFETGIVFLDFAFDCDFNVGMILKN
jgi:hypothetical protein